MKKQYFYYVCANRACKFNVRAENANALFAEQLKKMKPAPEALALFREIVVDKWKEKYETLAEETTRTTKETLALRERKASLFKLMEQSADCPELVQDLKQQYGEVSKQLTLATMERVEREFEEYDAETVMNYCTYFLENAYELWEKATVEAKFRFQSLLFPDGIRYDALQGLQTPQTSLVYEAIQALDGGENLLAAPGRIELPLTD